MDSKIISSAAKHVGQAPGAVVYVGYKNASNLFIEVFDYTADSIAEKELRDIEEAFQYKSSETMTWININGLNHVDAIERIGKEYDFHPLMLEDIVNTHQRPKMDDFETYIFVVLKMLYFDKEEKLKIEHISCVLGQNYVVSFQEAEGDVLNPLRERIRQGKGKIRKMGADYLMYSLMDAVVDHYYHLIEAMGEKIEEIEDNLFAAKADADVTYDIQNLKKEVLKIRRAVFPLREVVNKMEKSDNSLISETTQFYLRDLYDHIIQVSENVEIQREMIWGLMDMFMSSISNKMNEVMKVLTIIATIFIPLTFIAGIYGMNFKNIPELNYENGYFILLAVMVIIFLGMLYYFKRRKWL